VLLLQSWSRRRSSSSSRRRRRRRRFVSQSVRLPQVGISAQNYSTKVSGFYFLKGFFSISFDFSKVFFIIQMVKEKFISSYSSFNIFLQ